MFLAVFLLFFISKQFAITDIQVEGIDASVEINEKELPKNLLFFPTARVETELGYDYPQFQSIVIDKKWPHTLVVRFVPRMPIALLKTVDRNMAIDAKGYIVGDSANSRLPVISLAQKSTSTGKQITDKSISISLAFLSEMGQDDGIREIRIGDDQSIVVRINEMIIYLKSDGDGGEQARTLQRLLTGFRIRGPLPKSIDLRFSKPVVQL